MSNTQLKEDVKKIIYNLGIEYNKIVIKETNSSIKCDKCYRLAYNTTILFPCQHDICTRCTDDLTDSYVGLSQEILFKCPFCRKNVNNIEYK